MAEGNVLYYGDNLDVLRRYVKDETVDLVYLDPPFNSNQDYNVLFGERNGTQAAAQIKAFEDTWTWDEGAARAYQETVEAGGRSSEAMQAFRRLLGESDMLAYLSMMAPRLIELRRVLKADGSIYLHCDPTASHYLKLLLDSIFSPANFRNEIIWKRTSAHSSSRRYGPVHDVLLFYSEGDGYVWNPVYQPYEEAYLEMFYEQVDPDGRRWKRGDLTGDGVRAGESGLVWKGVDVTKKGRHWAIPREASERLGLEGKGLIERLEAINAAGLIHWPKKAGAFRATSSTPTRCPASPFKTCGRTFLRFITSPLKGSATPRKNRRPSWNASSGLPATRATRFLIRFADAGQRLPPPSP